MTILKIDSSITGDASVSRQLTAAVTAHAGSPGIPGVRSLLAHVDGRHFIELARTAERGKLDMIFFADGAGIRQGDNPPGSLARTLACPPPGRSAPTPAPGEPGRRSRSPRADRRVIRSRS